MSIEKDILDAAGAVQGKVTGLIIPPPDIRAIIDKTATFVAKNGSSFEQKILNSAEGKTAKFNFMRPFDPNHAYYEYKIKEVEEGRPPLVFENAVKPPQQLDSSRASTVIATTKASFVSPIARLTSNNPHEPQLLDFSIVHPSGISALDFDIMRLTAQYTAANGRDFLAGIAQREQRNPQFDFLKPTHMLFNYFTSLVDSYSKILVPSSDLKAKLRESSSALAALKTAVNRWDWNRIEGEKRKNSEQEADEERKAYQSIDWFDFIVVETIDFPEDELLEGTVPKQPLPSGVQAPAHAPLKTQSVNVPPPPPSRPTTSILPLADQDMDMDMDDGDLKVVSNYIPRTAQSTSSTLMMVDPISGKAIPADKVEDHMRVQLIDPSYKVQQKRFQEKQLETGFAEGSSIADSLKLFAKKRSDIFGKDERNDADADMEDVSPAVQWDGHQSSIAMTMQMKSEFSSKAPETAVIHESNVGPRPLANSATQVLPITSIAPQVVPITNTFAVTPVGVPPILGQAAPTQWSNFVNAPPPPFPQQPTGFVNYSIPSHTDQGSEYIDQDQTMIPEEEFAARYPNPIVVSVIAPVDNSTAAANWGLQGQTVKLSISVRSLCKDIKDQISGQFGGMPVNKQQLRLRNGWFLKDASSLAAMNVGDGSILELSVRSRGGKK